MKFVISRAFIITISSKYIISIMVKVKLMGNDNLFSHERIEPTRGPRGLPMLMCCEEAKKFRDDLFGQLK